MQSVAARREVPPRGWPLAALIAILAATGGCGMDVEYLVPQVIGQADILLGAVPIQKVIESGTLSEEEHGKLLMLLDARRFARDVMGLDTEDSYTSFYDTGDGPVAYNVSACANPQIWIHTRAGLKPRLIPTPTLIFVQPYSAGSFTTSIEGDPEPGGILTIQDQVTGGHASRRRDATGLERFSGGGVGV